LTSSTIDNDENIQDPTTFAIHDNSSKFARFSPEKYIEPLVIIARIKGYKRIDDYILELIQDRVEMFTDTRDNLNEDFQKYMHNTIKGKDVPNEWAPSKEEDKEEEGN
jgi:hypothetical protein